MPYSRRLASRCPLAYISDMKFALVCSRAEPRVSTLRLGVLLLALWLGSCGGAAPGYDPATGQAVPASGNVAVGGAVATAAAAAVIWATAGGCKLQGCPYGSVCNKKSGFCDVIKCEDGCPDGTICNEGLHRCQAPPPPKTPNDFLPQDSKLNPPGYH
jgi:hypothetical protein